MKEKIKLFLPCCVLTVHAMHVNTIRRGGGQQVRMTSPCEQTH